MARIGKVSFINQSAKVAVVDVGWGEAFVVEYEADSELSVGDTLFGLKRCYYMFLCFNKTKMCRIPITVLSGGLSMSTAKQILGSEFNLNAVA